MRRALRCAVLVAAASAWSLPAAGVELAEYCSSLDCSHTDEDLEALELKVSLLQTTLHLRHGRLHMVATPEGGAPRLPAVHSVPPGPPLSPLLDAEPVAPAALSGPAWAGLPAGRLGELLLESSRSSAAAVRRWIERSREDSSLGATRAALTAALTGRSGLAGGLPVLLIFMMVFVIGVVFVIQVVSIITGPHRDREFSFRDAAARPHNYAYTAGGPFLPMPSQQSLASYSPDNMGMPSESPQTIPPDSPTEAICPSWMQPYGELQFCFAIDSIRKLGTGENAVEILGPGGRPLLYARLQAFPSGGSGAWLELSTTSSSGYSNASVGPLQPGAPVTKAFQIRGPGGETYGALEPVKGGGWKATRSGRVLLLLDAVPKGLAFSARAPDGHVVASTALLSGSAGSAGQSLKVQVNPGVDALLTLLCVLAAMRMSSDLTGLRSGGGSSLPRYSFFG